MEETTKKRLEVLLAILILIGVVVLVLFLLLRRPPSEEAEEVQPEVEEMMEVAPIEEAFIPPGPHEVAPQTVIRVFVERFGSYSSESNYENVDDVLQMTTPSLQPRLEQLASDARRNSSNIYYGISTRIIAMNEIELTDKAAVFSITTQREESIDSPANTTVRYQDIVVELVKDGLGWLVDDFEWK
ncbi:hypothetical protein IH979_03225 [Patescibacteria group bacterium]|nr:hypothetical protein [Patescibacteria group bacterium]